MSEILLLQTDERGVCTLTLNRPEYRNALDGILISEILQALRRAAEDPAIRVVILAGSGDAFCAGADLRWLHGHGTLERIDQAGGEIGALMAALQELRKPTIARVQGAARGGGAGLVCCCDVVVAAIDATFAFSEVRLGLLPAVIAPCVLGAIGPRQARRYLLSGEIIDSERALAIGLVHEVVKLELLGAAVEKIVAALLQGGPHVVSETKRLLTTLASGTQMSLSQRSDLLTRLATSPEAQEGIAAFLEKRKPSWASPSPTWRGSKR